MSAYSWYSVQDSPIHKVSPLIKGAFTLSMWLIAVFFQHPFWNGLQVLLIVSLLALAKIPRKIFMAFAKPMAPIVTLYFILWPFLLKEGLTLFQANLGLISIQVTQLGIAWGLMAALRLAGIFLSTFLLLATTSETQLNSSLLNVGVPFPIVLTLTLSARFVTIALADITTIQEARRARGMPERVGIFGFIRNLLTLLIPLLLVSLKRVQTVTNAIEARAFSSTRKRTFFHETTITPSTILTITFIVLATAAIGILRLWYGEFAMIPSRV